MMRDLQTGQPVILSQIQHVVPIAACVSVILVAVAMITACVYTLANMLYATFIAYVFASLMMFVVLSLALAAMIPLWEGKA